MEKDMEHDMNMLKLALFELYREELAMLSSHRPCKIWWRVPQTDLNMLDNY